MMTKLAVSDLVNGPVETFSNDLALLQVVETKTSAWEWKRKTSSLRGMHAACERPREKVNHIITPFQLLHSKLQRTYFSCVQTLSRQCSMIQTSIQIPRVNRYSLVFEIWIRIRIRIPDLG